MNYNYIVVCGVADWPTQEQAASEGDRTQQRVALIHIKSLELETKFLCSQNYKNGEVGDLSESDHYNN